MSGGYVESISIQNDLAAPTSAQGHFSQQFDINQPDRAMSSYQKIMHEHTKQQFKSATDSSRRRSADPTKPVASLAQSGSSRGSVDSSAS